MASAFLIVMLTVALGPVPTRASRELKSLDELFQEKEERALAFATRMSELYEARCSSFSDCSGSSYDNCVTEYPGQQCPAEGIKVPACGMCEGADAGAALFDYTVSAVRLPESQSQGSESANLPSTDQAAETICYSRGVDEFFLSKHAEDASSGIYGDQPPQMYFGSSTGAFRIFPARHATSCGAYDPRIRPWYVAASSGPKDVVLILDVSGSMGQRSRATLMVDAAKAVVKTLTIADYFAVVLFSDRSELLFQDSPHLMQATAANKERAIAALESVAVGGGTNFLAGFERAFELLRASIAQEFTASCHRALLFLTDGQDTTSNDQIVPTIAAANGEFGAHIFSYSLGNGADATLPKAISCANLGVWSAIVDGGDLVGSMASYYQLFARGLGDAENAGFTAWVEPYAFATGNAMGTAVSAPVYDRSLTPPHFIGVAAVDMTVSFLEEQSGSSYQNLLARLIARSTATCPRLEMSVCALQALRLSTGGRASVCLAGEGHGAEYDRDDCMTAEDTVQRRNGLQYDPPRCLRTAPRDVWANTALQGVGYEDRACCAPGATEPGCPGSIVPLIVGVSIGALLVVLILLKVTIEWCKGILQARDTGDRRQVPQARTPAVQQPVVEGVPMGRPVY